jgi:hypothetical protein
MQRPRLNALTAQDSKVGQFLHKIGRSGACEGNSQNTPRIDMLFQQTRDAPFHRESFPRARAGHDPQESRIYRRNIEGGTYEVGIPRHSD